MRLFSFKSVTILIVMLIASPLNSKSSRNHSIKKNERKENTSKIHKKKLTKQSSKAYVKNTKAESRRQQRKERRKREPEQRKTISTMNYEELKAAKEKLLAKGDKKIAIKYLEKMVPLCGENLEELRQIMLELADLLFDLGDLEKAEKVYTEFAKLFPGSDKVEYASYKAILCHFYSTLDAERDQSKTKETIELAEKFLDRSDIFKTHEKDVKDIKKKCVERLLESEINIVNFYMNGGKLAQAQKRLEGIRSDFLTQLPDIEPRIISLECQLAEKQGNTKLAESKRTQLAEKFPKATTTLAKDKPKNQKYVNRF